MREQSGQEQTGKLRPATVSDADDLARLVNYAGEGLPYRFWKMIAEDGEDPWIVGRSRAARDAGSFSWRNATIAEIDGMVAAALITYAIAEPDGPPDTSDMPPVFVPLEELEALAGGTFYVNVIAAYSEYRGKGLGTRLLSEAERMAAGRRLSLIVSDGNKGACRLYERFGFKARDKRPIVGVGDWECEGKNWVLMVK
jgi:ribosomal protein S18 acetylase RimI-like enzyme